MEKSIENIWKEGFLKSDTLIAPKVNNLYNQKSIHIIDKFTKMFKINLIAMVAFSFIFLGLSYFVGIPVMGAIFFVVLNIMAYVNKGLLNGLQKVDKAVNSYDYLKTFSEWINEVLAINKKMSRFIYPIIFMSLILGFWFKDAEGIFLGERLLTKVLTDFPDLSLIFGIPVVAVLAILFIIGLLAFFGDKIYQWDFKIVYGRVMKKLDELLGDLESLRA